MSAPGTTTSGSYLGNPTATRIISAAFLDLAVIDDIETPSAAMLQKGLSKINALFKEWYATGLHVWTEEEAVLFMQQGQVRYLIGGDSTDHIADANAYVQNALASDAAAAATSLILEDATGLLDGDQFGIVLDTGAAFWTTLDGDPSGDTVAIADALPSAASAMNFVYGYTTNIVRPLKIPFSRRIQWAAPGSYPILTPLTAMMSRQEYMNLPNPLSPGVVTQAFYNPARDQGELYVWPSPSNAAQGLRFTWYRPIQSLLTGTDLPDFPVEWENAIEWNLAKELALGYSVPQERGQYIIGMAKEKLEIVQGWDRESTPIYMGVSMDQTARN